VILGFIRAILLLPGTVLFFIPALLLRISPRFNLVPRLSNPGEFQFWAAIGFFLVGIILSVWTMRLQFVIGRGTPAPWDPPAFLVIQGPYQHVRNPMITGVFCILLGESLLFHSWLIAGCWFLFVLGNLIYMPFVEEVDLEDRFGETYQQYKANVPRWIPRRKPWAE
jgi:protein-S-isoprenylcysteine O-methyltransferase Ste14